MEPVSIRANPVCLFEPTFLIISTMAIGWHYLGDVLSSFLLASGIIFVIERYNTVLQ
jgi:hypothetical protein